MCKNLRLRKNPTTKNGTTFEIYLNHKLCGRLFYLEGDYRFALNIIRPEEASGFRTSVLTKKFPNPDVAKIWFEEVKEKLEQIFKIYPPIDS